MTTPRLSDPERWTERSPGGRAAEDVLGGALRRARAAVEPSEALLARVETGVAPVTAVAASRRWRVALATLAGLLAISGTVGAARGPLRGWATRHGLFGPAVPPVEVAPARPRQQAHAPTKVAALVTPTPELAPAREAEAAGEGAAAPLHPPALRASVVARRAPGGHDAVEPPPVPEPLAPQPPAVADEARILRGVFAGLRSGSAGGAAALAALDDYDRRYPSGMLRGEARLARVEALLGLGRRADALALLDAWEAGGATLTREARTARGELRAEAGRCAEASQDFSAVLAGEGSAADERGGRALYGRASCALRAGDEGGAVAALSRYLAAQPDGAQAPAVRDALARLGATPSP